MKRRGELGYRAPCSCTSSVGTVQRLSPEKFLDPRAEGGKTRGEAEHSEG